MLEHMSYWQKGILFSLGFSLLVSIAITGSLLVSEYVAESRGIPHVCSASSDTGLICSLDEAVGERLSMLPKIFLITSIPLCALSFAVGMLIDKLVQKL
jgi:hypothetical protein